MTHEEFAHLCLKIKSGDTSIEIPCCANCKYYKEAISEYGNTFYKCKRPDIQQGARAWIHTKPEDFCSRFEKRKDK